MYDYYVTHISFLLYVLFESMNFFFFGFIMKELHQGSSLQIWEAKRHATTHQPMNHGNLRVMSTGKCHMNDDWAN